MKYFLIFLCLIFCHRLTSQHRPDSSISELTDPQLMFAQGQDLSQAEKICDSIYRASGFANTFMVVTPAGNVIIDTSMPENAERHKRLLQAVNDGPVKYIILTHGHRDHRGGVSAWREEKTTVIAHRNFVEFRHYQERLAGFFTHRNNAQFDQRRKMGAPAGNYGAEIEANLLVDDHYSFELGGIQFDIHHTPGETYDHLSIWLPQFKVAFVGDNFYRSFPNLYTLRGTKPRWALDYVNSHNKILSWEPDIMIPSHGPSVHGKEEIQKQLKTYRDAVLYVHDHTVEGMNQGKDVHTLMQTISLPDSLDVGATYGMISWVVRGIYEGYAGWFDGNPSNMYPTQPSDIYPDLLEMAGGMEAIVDRAEHLLEAGETQQALRMLDIGLDVFPEDKAGLTLKLRIFKQLESSTNNSNERGWLRYGIRETEKALKTNK
ncbi:MAG: alkyl sulfatase dimerization domain-containing protein [Bacteroidota bacterium]